MLYAVVLRRNYFLLATERAWMETSWEVPEQSILFPFISLETHQAGSAISKQVYIDLVDSHTISSPHDSRRLKIAIPPRDADEQVRASADYFNPRRLLARPSHFASLSFLTLPDAVVRVP
jgi:hypothetical protein